jgi:hypothetical protein
MDLLKTALIKLIKLIKTVRFYPPEHPTLTHVGEETAHAFEPLLQNGNLVLKVRKDGIVYDTETIGREHASIRSLGHFLFTRRVQQLLFLPDLTVRDLIVFARQATLKPADIQAKGGLQELLLNQQAACIWINELDLSVIRATKERMRHLTETPAAGSELPSKTPGRGEQQIQCRDGITAETTGDAQLDEHIINQLSLTQILNQLPGESSERRFQKLLNRIPTLLVQHLSEQHLPLVLQTFQALTSLLNDRQLSKPRRNNAINCLNRTADQNTIIYLINMLCMRGVPRTLRDQNIQTLVLLGEKSAKPLINRLAGEKDTLARKLLSTTLAALEDAAVPDLLKALHDHRWYMVRNVVGQIGNPGIVDHLIPLLWHADLRIARESIRALARIGGDQTVEALLQLIDSGQRELYPQAIIALGIIRNPAAVPSLVRIVKRRDPFKKKTELKISAIKALARIASPEASPVLERLAKRRRRWGRSRQAALRVQAIAALAQIGNPGSRPTLEALCRDPDQRIAQFASRQLKQWPKA